MAIVNSITHKPLGHDSQHTLVDCTYSIVDSPDGKRYLQLDTYGSKTRKITGKKSQSIRFSIEAIDQLKNILSQNGF